MCSSSDIGRTVEVLAAGVEEVDLPVRERLASSFVGFVVDHCTIGSDRADRVKRGASEMLTSRAKAVHFASASILS